MIKTDIKKELLHQCKAHLSKRRKAVQQTLEGIAISLREETKSSAGDKHETGRAMLQLERENAGKQLAEIEKLENIYNRINNQISKGPVHLGSVVETNGANYFISIPVGEVKIRGVIFYAIGMSSPIGQLLLGKEIGDSVRFRESEIIIDDIY